jgi:hypothetical protein
MEEPERQHGAQVRHGGHTSSQLFDHECRIEGGLIAVGLLGNDQGDQSIRHHGTPQLIGATLAFDLGIGDGGVIGDHLCRGRRQHPLLVRQSDPGHTPPRPSLEATSPATCAAAGATWLGRAGHPPIGSAAPCPSTLDTAAPPDPAVQSLSWPKKLVAAGARGALRPRSNAGAVGIGPHGLETVENTTGALQHRQKLYISFNT